MNLKRELKKNNEIRKNFIVLNYLYLLSIKLIYFTDVHRSDDKFWKSEQLFLKMTHWKYKKMFLSKVEIKKQINI